MKTKWIQSVILSSALCLGSAGWAAVLSWSGGSGNWDTDASWGGSEPTAADTAQLNNGSTITVDLAGKTAGSLNASSGTVEVKAGGNLALTTSIGLNGGTLLVSGGTVTANYQNNDGITSGGELSITAGSFSRSTGQFLLGAGGVGTLSVSGTGSYSGGSLAPWSTGTSTLNLTGSSASISVSQIKARGAINNFNLTLDSGGINPITMATTFDLNGTSTLNLDLLAYDLDNGDQVELFSYSGWGGNNWDTVLINGTSLGSISIASGSTTPFSTGSWRGDFVVASGSIYLDNLVLIPEPATLALLVAGLGLIAAIRRRIK